MSRPADVRRSRLRWLDLLATGAVGLGTRRLRTALSALGISIGIAAIIAVLGITRSSQANLLSTIDELGTNLLTVVNGQTLGGQEAELPTTAPATIGRTDGVIATAPTALLGGVHVYRTDRIPSYETGSLDVRAGDLSLLPTLNATLEKGAFLNAATSQLPAVVLGHGAAQILGIGPGARIWITYNGSGHWFTVAGVLRPQVLAPEIDRSTLIGFPIAANLLGYDGHPSRIYVRADTAKVTAAAKLLARSTDPQHPEQVDVSRPSDALTAEVAVQSSGTLLVLGLGAVALLVGGIGIANVMVISVLERRREIGLRRALGAARRHIAGQFFVESQLLAVLGGLGGLVIGIGITTVMARLHNWTVIIPSIALWGGLGAALLIGTIAGLYPALRAAQLPPTVALRT
jgi:putative ABC transport system permease protein